jgi:hypothetical protein
MIAKLSLALIILLFFCGCMQPIATPDETVRSSGISPVQTEQTLLYPFSIHSTLPISTQEQAPHIDGSINVPVHVIVNGPSSYKNWETIFLSGTGPRNQTLSFSITGSSQTTVKLSPEKISHDGIWNKNINLKELSLAPGLAEISISLDTPNAQPSTVILLIRS